MLLALCMLLALTACAGTDDPTQPPQGSGTSDPTGSGCEEDPTINQPELPQVTVDNPATYISINYTDAEGNYYCLNAWDNDEGQAYVEYVGQEKKVGTFELSVLHNITQAIDASGLAALNGRSVYEDGECFASMYVLYKDTTYLGADFSGKIDPAFMDAYNQLDSFFRELTAGLPVYVPQPVVMGEIDPAVLSAMTEILTKTGMPNLDSLYISDVPQDEFFGITLGLTDTTGIINGTSCGPVMLATAYSFVIVTVSEDADISAIRADFVSHLEWNKWVCVSASNAMIAQKGNMLLCLMSAGDMYTMTADAITASGWTDIETYSNPTT